MPLTKLKRQRTVDEVYNALREAILSGLFKAGERLQIDEITDRLGVSPTPIRQAVHQLAAEGLVEVRPRSGTFVATLSVKDLEDTFEIRCALECLAAEKAVGRMDEAGLLKLRQLVNSMKRPIRSKADQKRHEQDNLDFHRTLIAACGNKRLAEIYEDLHAHIKMARIHRSEQNWQDRLDKEQDEHDEILQALEQRDNKRLTEAMKKHIRRAADEMVRVLRSHQTLEGFSE